MYSQITNGLSALRIPNRFDLGESCDGSISVLSRAVSWAGDFFLCSTGHARDDSHPNLLYTVTLSVLVFLFLLQFVLQI